MDLKKFVPVIRSPLAQHYKAPTKNEKFEQFASICEQRFHNVPRSFFSEFWNKCRLSVYQNNEVIVRQNSQCEALFFIMEGTVSLLVSDSNYKDLTVGSFFGEVSVVYERPSLVSAVSKGNTVCAYVNKEFLDSLFMKYPAVERQLRDVAQERLSDELAQRTSCRLSNESALFVEKPLTVKDISFVTISGYIRKVLQRHQLGNVLSFKDVYGFFLKKGVVKYKKSGSCLFRDMTYLMLEGKLKIGRKIASSLETVNLDGFFGQNHIFASKLQKIVVLENSYLIAFSFSDLMALCMKFPLLLFSLKTLVKSDQKVPKHKAPQKALQSAIKWNPKYTQTSLNTFKFTDKRRLSVVESINEGIQPPKRPRFNSVCTSNKTVASNKSIMSKFSDKELVAIFQFLDLKTCVKIRRVCKQWYRVLKYSPELFHTLDLSIYKNDVDDAAVISIADFVGPRVRILDLSECYHLTDSGFSYLVNEIGIHGQLQKVIMRSLWNLSPMSLMDVTFHLISKGVVEMDLSNCKRVGDEIIQRMGNLEALPFGSNLKSLNLSYCKCVTDKAMFHIANTLSPSLEYLNLKRCTTITDAGFEHWNSVCFVKLKSLVIADCSFLTDKSIQSIVLSAPGLLSLDCSFCCALTEVSIKLLQNATQLSILNLDFCGNAVSDTSMLQLSVSMCFLRNLSVRGCAGITRAGVDVLLSGVLPLERLCISQCRYVNLYPGGEQAVMLPLKQGTRSSFVKTSPDKGVVEIVM